MPEIGVKDINNKDVGNLNLSDDLFGITGKDSLMHSAVVNYLANQRQGTAATKNRALVRGGGKKPYKQKGTGRARHGSIRSPLMRGGGVTFGPTPRDYSYRMPRKQRRLALYAALSAKLSDDEIVVVEGFGLEGPRTRNMVEIIDSLGVGGGSLLIVLDKEDRNVALSARNIPGVKVKSAADLHAYDVLAPRKLLVTRAALDSMQGGEKG
jgi:large subunit ribosomal protein L4